MGEHSFNYYSSTIYQMGEHTLFINIRLRNTKWVSSLLINIRLRSTKWVSNSLMYQLYFLYGRFLYGKFFYTVQIHIFTLSQIYQMFEYSYSYSFSDLSNGWDIHISPCLRSIKWMRAFIFYPVSDLCIKWMRAFIFLPFLRSIKCMNIHIITLSQIYQIDESIHILTRSHI
jgi:hypothetical protein